MNIEQFRADFEAWYTAQYTSYIPRSGNGYSNLDTELAWQAYQAGRAALQSQDREDAQEIASTLATVLHFIPKQDEPELYADIERLYGEFIDHARRIEEMSSHDIDIALPSSDEAAAHMLPSDLKKFEFGEHVAEAFSIAVGNPDETSQPLFTLEQVRSAIEADRQARFTTERAQLEAEWVKLRQMQDAYKQARGESVCRAPINNKEVCGAQNAESETQPHQIPEGYKLVPIELTDEMIEAGCALYDASLRQRYKAMLEATQEPKGEV